MEWLTEANKLRDGGIIAVVIMVVLKGGQLWMEWRRGDRADDLSERRYTDESFEKLSKEYREQWKDCLARCDQLEQELDEKDKRIAGLEHDLRNEQSKVKGYQWLAERLEREQKVRVTQTHDNKPNER